MTKEAIKNRTILPRFGYYVQELYFTLSFYLAAIAPMGGFKCFSSFRRRIFLKFVPSAKTITMVTAKKKKNQLLKLDDVLNGIVSIGKNASDSASLEKDLVFTGSFSKDWIGQI